MTKYKNSGLLITVAVIVVLSACKKDEVAVGEFVSLSCENDSVNDSQLLVDGSIQRIRSHQQGSVYRSLSVRGVTVDYMVHGEGNPDNKALIILIAGGQLEAKITGTVEGLPAVTSSGNFLVRSAHLFAANNYKVVTIDRPSDYSFYTGGNTNSGYAMDSYRTSMNHFSDINAIIEAENTPVGLKVIIAGTSRGAISAVAQHTLADYLLISAPVTSGNNGTPVGHSMASPSDVGDKPVHLIWHKQDDCVSSKPAGAKALTTQFANVTGVEVSGGYNDPETGIRNPGCKGNRTYHGFVGIESCVINNVTSWLDAKLLEP